MSPHTKQSMLLPFSERPGYEKREWFQPYIDINRGGGLLGESDFTESDLPLQIILTNMAINSNPNNSKAKGYLVRLHKLDDLCREKGGHNIEARLKTPQDIFYAFKKYNI